MTPTSGPPSSIASPCIKVCRLDAAGACVGCGRTLEEIAAWSRLSADEQRIVCANAARRLAQGFVGPASNPEEPIVDVIERIKSQLSSNPILLYMKGTPDFPQCGFSAAAVRALSASGAEFAHVNIFEDPEVRDALKQYSNWPTYPQLYVNGELIGGSDIILEMYKSGELQKLVAAAK